MEKRSKAAHGGAMLPTARKRTGAYYTPPAVAAALVRWVVREAEDQLLDPSCGDGEFIALHKNSTGVDKNPEATSLAQARAPAANVLTQDFFSWAGESSERFDCAVGNPPFIRYQTFKGEIRARALRICSALGVTFSGLSSSWAPFIVAAASILRPSGRLAFVVPAEIGHAPYAAPVLDYLVSRFRRVHVIAIRSKLFPDLSEDCWLLYAEGAGGTTNEIEFTAVDAFSPTAEPPAAGIRVPVADWRSTWKQRLRPFLMSSDARELYRCCSTHPTALRLRDVASVGIGYVSGANQFFHLRPSEADRWGIPDALLQQTVRKGSDLSGESLVSATVKTWMREDRSTLLLRLPRDLALPDSVSRYLDTEAGCIAREGYKCRHRDPWWSVPDVRIPDFFLTYMSGRAPKLVRNVAGCACTNSLHGVRITQIGIDPQAILRQFARPLTLLSCEVEGHPLGGGMLKLEPREAGEILLSSSALAGASPLVFEEAIETLRQWRHYSALPNLGRNIASASRQIAA